MSVNILRCSGGLNCLLEAHRGYVMLALPNWSPESQPGINVPYRSSDSERRSKAQLGVGWSLWGSTPPTPIPERILDGIPGFLAWFAFFFCLASAVAFPRTLLLIAALLGMYTALRFAVAGLANFWGLAKIRRWEQTDWYEHYQQHADASALPWEAVQHLVIIPNYKEPLRLMRRTLNVLSAQYEADKRLTVILAMEAGEEGCAQKAEQLIAEYGSRFKQLYFTVHPRGLPGEMQCKSANESWAARWAKRTLVDEQGENLDHICVTTMDADTRWHPQYFYALTALFALNEQRHHRFWQAPIRYHGNIWNINPLLRIVNAYATSLELSYLSMMPWWKALPMSSYSLSLRLLHISGYWDGDVIADEWHMYIKAYFAQDGDLDLEPVMLPFIADATVGNGLPGELRERYLQTLRHAWGSKEIGYMIAKLIDHPEAPFMKSFRLLGRISHDILMAGAGWVILTVGSQLPVLLHPQIAPIDLLAVLRDPSAGVQQAVTNLIEEPTWILLLSAGSLVVLLAIVFWVQDVRTRPPRNRPLGLMERVWTLLSFPLMPILTLIVLALPTIQAQTRLLMGIPLQFRVAKKV